MILQITLLLYFRGTKRLFHQLLSVSEQDETLEKSACVSSDWTIRFIVSVSLHENKTEYKRWMSLHLVPGPVCQ